MNLQDEARSQASPGLFGLPSPLGIVFLVAALFILLGVFYLGRVTADGNEPASLMEQVTKGPRSGFVADNVRGQVCVYLVKGDKTAENRKSCVSAKHVLNLGKKFEELDAVELTQGIGLFRISRDTRYGVSDGVIFELIDQLPEPPAPPASPTVPTPTLPNSGDGGS